MGGPRFLAYILNAVRLFSFHPSQSENMAYLSPSNSPPVPVIDNDLPYDRYSEAVRQLCLLLLPTCPSFEPGEVRVVGDTPIAAGGFADIWRATCDATSIVQKSYRCYETGDVGSISQVRIELSYVPHGLRSVSEVPQRGVGARTAFSPQRYPIPRDQSFSKPPFCPYP